MDNLVQAKLAPRLFPLSGNAGGEHCRPVNGGARFLLRLPAAAVAPAAEALGADLTAPINRACAMGGGVTLRLGPDEWLLLLPEAEAFGVLATLEARLTDSCYSVTDISHRQTAITIEGAAATAILNGGCPLDFDIEAFPAGTATRTIFLKAEIVLWRQSETRFHLEVWRSFAPYVWDLLTIISREYTS